MSSEDTDTLAAAEDQPNATSDEGVEKSEETTRLELTTKVDARGACQRHVTVTVSRADIDRYLEKAYSELRGKAEIPGFRPGRAPRKLVESRFKDQIKDQVKGSLLMDSMAQINDDNLFTAISEPSFDLDAVLLPDEGPLTFEFDIEVRPEFEMPKWQGLSLQRPVHEISDEEVDEHLGRVLRRYCHKSPVEDAIRRDDFLTVNLTARHEGKEIARATELETEVKPVLSLEDARLADFHKLVEGKKAPDRVTATVQVSAESHNEALRGKDVELELEILDVKRMVRPELTSSFLAELGGFESADEVYDLVRRELERQFRYHQNRAIRRQITAQLTAAADWELPPDLLRRQARREMDRVILELRRSGFSDDQIRAHVNELSQNSLKSTATALKEHFILERIAEEEKVDVTPEDYDEEIALIAEQEDEPVRRVRARLEKRGLMDTLRNQIVERKVIDLITAQASFTETEFTRPDGGGSGGVSAVAVSLGGSPPEEAIPEAKHAGGGEEPLPNSPESR